MIDLALSLDNYNNRVFPGVMQRAGCCLLGCWLWLVATSAVPSLSGVAGSELSAPAEAAAPAPVLGTEPRLPWLRQDDPLQPDQCHQADRRSDMMCMCCSTPVLYMCTLLYKCTDLSTQDYPLRPSRGLQE